MAKKFPIQQKDVERLNHVTVQLFNKSFWQIYQQETRRFIYLFDKGERQKQEIGQPVATKLIYPEIKLLMDRKGTIIGKRMERAGLLLSTAENRLKQAPRKRKYELTEPERKAAMLEGKNYRGMAAEKEHLLS